MSAAAMGHAVSVVIPTYNAVNYVAETLRSVMQQSYQPAEVIVVDDGSTDGTVSLVGKTCPSARIIVQGNSGVCVARNTGVAASTGELIAFLDADDLWDSRKLACQVETFRTFPGVDVVAVDFDEINARGERLIRDVKRRRHLFGKPIDLHQTFLQTGNFLSVSACMVRREAFLRVGGFYATERILSGDYDLWIRMSEHGKFCVRPEILCHYRVLSESQIHGSLSKEYGAQRRILEMHRHRFSDGTFRRRLSHLHCDWADSALYQGDPQAWSIWRKALTYNVWSREVWMLGMRAAARQMLGRGPGSGGG